MLSSFTYPIAIFNALVRQLILTWSLLHLSQPRYRWASSYMSGINPIIFVILPLLDLHLPIHFYKPYPHLHLFSAISRSVNSLFIAQSTPQNLNATLGIQNQQEEQHSRPHSSHLMTKSTLVSHWGQQMAGISVSTIPNFSASLISPGLTIIILLWSRLRAGRIRIVFIPLTFRKARRRPLPILTCQFKPCFSMLCPCLAVRCHCLVMRCHSSATPCFA